MQLRNTQSEVGVATNLTIRKREIKTITLCLNILHRLRTLGSLEFVMAMECMDIWHLNMSNDYYHVSEANQSQFGHPQQKQIKVLEES
jgi:hypothetical protein